MLLEQSVPALQGALVGPVLAKVRGEAVEHRAVEEGPPDLRAALHHREVVRGEGDHAHPSEVVLELRGLLPVDEGLPDARRDLDGDLPLGAAEGEPSGDRGLLGPEAHQLGEPVRPERTERAEEVHRLEQAGLALSVRAHHHGRMRRGAEADRLEVAKVGDLESLEEHYTRMGMTTAV